MLAQGSRLLGPTQTHHEQILIVSLCYLKRTYNSGYRPVLWHYTLRLTEFTTKAEFEALDLFDSFCLKGLDGGLGQVVELAGIVD